MVWRHMSCSLSGAAHEAAGIPCQDSCAVTTLHLPGQEEEAVLVACVADGAGSVRHSDEGSALACQVIQDNIAAFLRAHAGLENIQRSDVVGWCAHVRRVLQERADAWGRPLKDYATTLCVAMLSARGSVFFQIGDGAMILNSHGAFGVVFWPQSGEYANTTNFVTTEDFQNHLEYMALDTCFEGVALLTDGLERMALDFAHLTPHAPFFEPLFKTLAAADPAEDLSAQLRQFLQSEPVQSRSDDDKSLIVATRHDGCSEPR